MKNSTNGNMYATTLENTWELFEAHLSGSESAVFCVVSLKPLEQPSQSAFTSVAAALGYGSKACTFISIQADEQSVLDEYALFLLLEGLDPYCLVLSDCAARSAFEKAYRCSVDPNTAGRAFGRTFVAFTSFSDMLDDGQEKQIAWSLLKKLPKYGECS